MYTTPHMYKTYVVDRNFPLFVVRTAKMCNNIVII
jgi:hypothetical protein